LESCREAVLVLGRMEHPELKPQATKILQSLLQNHPLGLTVAGKQAIALGLGHLGQPTAATSLNILLMDADASVRFHAIAALNHLRHPV
jgi:HEAT repeat protein